MSITTFERVCNELEATSSRSAKEVIFAAALQDRVTEQLFVSAINPLVQFYTKVPVELGSCLAPDEVVFETLAGLQLRVPEFVDRAKTLPLGRWVCRLINKNLGVGVSINTLRKLLPGNSFKLNSYVVEKSKLTSNDWLELLHHLPDSRSYLLQYERVGIRAIVHLMNGKAFPVAEVPLIKWEGFEQELVSMFEPGTQLIGRIVMDLPLPDIYGYVTEVREKGGAYEGSLPTRFQILDVIREGTFMDRVKYISDYYVANDNVLWMEPEVIDLDTLRQPQAAAGRGLLLYHPKGKLEDAQTLNHSLKVSCG